ncbi:hypothetical protein CTEN210_13059 [Chaetoceros tenuissimus]|uniref:5'-nucleotidase n=1 Tax=Chaetoceros tenuissimus TaxID=426638 RepID=A0AAD3HB38_9STRA|nr:hypothetical protein CTEN210_13059 [Chaetoceros tenuissimus]
MRNESDASDEIFVTKFRVFQINDVYLLNNLPRLATYIQDHMKILLPSIKDEIKKNLSYTETTKDYDPSTGKTVITTISTVIVVSGDFLAPSLLSSLDGGKGMVDVLHAIGVTHVSLGNHEDDVSTDSLKQHIDANKFEWVNTNLRGLDEALDVVTAECSWIEIGHENCQKCLRYLSG